MDTKMEDTLAALKFNRYEIDVPENPRSRGKVGAEDDRDWVGSSIVI
jgi:hypothetical protein